MTAYARRLLALLDALAIPRAGHMVAWEAPAAVVAAAEELLAEIS